MNEQQGQQLDKCTAEYLQESLMRIYRAGLALESINNVELEFIVNSECECDDLTFITLTASVQRLLHQ